jgi:hypothetical protein
LATFSFLVAASVLVALAPGEACTWSVTGTPADWSTEVIV